MSKVILTIGLTLIVCMSAGLTTYNPDLLLMAAVATGIAAVAIITKEEDQ